MSVQVNELQDPNDDMERLLSVTAHSPEADSTHAGDDRADLVTLSPIYDPHQPLNGNQIAASASTSVQAAESGSTTLQAAVSSGTCRHVVNFDDKCTQTETQTSHPTQSYEQEEGYLSEDDGHCDLSRLIKPPEPPLPMVWYPEDVPTVALIKKVNSMIDCVKVCQSLLAEPVSLLKLNLSFARDDNERIELHKQFANNKVLYHYESVSIAMDEVKKELKLLNRASQDVKVLAKADTLKNSSNESRNMAKEGVKYYICLKSTKARPLDPLRFFNEAVDGTDIHLNGSNPNGLDAKLFFTTEVEQNEALALLKAHKVGRFEAKDLYVITAGKTSDHIIRTDPFGKSTLLKLPFQEKGAIKVPDAIKALVSRNKAWLHSLEDVVDVQLHRLNEGKSGFALNLHLTKSAIARVRDGIKDSMKLDLTTKPISVHEPVKRDTCFKCHAPGHPVATCKSPYRCKYCPLIHKKARCPNIGKPVCYRCHEYNGQLGRGQQHLWLSENHVATSEKCQALGIRKHRVSDHQDDGRTKRARWE